MFQLLFYFKFKNLYKDKPCKIYSFVSPTGRKKDFSMVQDYHNHSEILTLVVGSVSMPMSMLIAEGMPFKKSKLSLNESVKHN